MTKTRHAEWWPLHLRASHGEKLDGVERAQYEIGLEELLREEEFALDLVSDTDAIRALKDEIDALRTERARLEQERTGLEREIAALSPRLDSRTQELLASRR